MKKTFLLFFISVLSHFAPAQTLITVAGSGTSGNGGDNGPALSAQFSNLTGVAIDPQGNIYISDAAYARVRRVDPNGNIYAYAGTGMSGGTGDNGSALNATLSSPCDVALDAAGNLYIADKGNGSIRKVDYSTGIITTVVRGLSAPSGVALDAKGNMYITEQTGNVVSKADTAGNVTIIAGTGTYGYSGDNGKATLAEIKSPYGICLDAIGNVYFTELGNGVCRKVDTAGIITTVAGDGTPGYTGDGIPATRAELAGAEGVVVDYQGNVYIADGGNDRIRIVDTSGFINTFIGTGGTINTTVGFEAGLAFDPLGNLYIVNNGNYKVQKLGFVFSPVAGFSAGDTSICAGSAINFNNRSTNATSFRWNFPGATPNNSTLPNPSNIIYDTAGSYNVQLIASGGNKYDTLLMSNYIHVIPAPQVGIITASEDTVCANTSVTLTANGSTGNFQWQSSNTPGNFSVINGATSDTFASLPLTSTIYYRLIATLGSCADTSGVLPIIVNPLPNPPVISTNDSIFCPYDSTLIQSSSSYFSYLWNNNDTGSSIYVNSTGNYSLTVMNAYGCSAVSGQQHITVFPITPVPKLSTNDSLICSSDSSRITASGTYSSYNWNTGDTIDYIYTSLAGGYWVSVTDANGCSAVSGHQEIGVYPVPSVSIVQQGDTLYSFGAVAYQWYFQDSIIPGAISPVYVAHKTGNYAVQITDTNGCTALSNNTFVNITGINQLEMNGGLNIYPNPFTNTIFIENKNPVSYIERVEIYDALGRLAFSERAVNPNLSQLKLDVTLLPAGAYYMLIKGAGAENSYRQVVKL